MKILHITNWYPSKPSPRSALWIKRQINTLETYCENEIWHVEILNDSFKIHKGLNHDGSRYFIIRLPFTIWKFYEILSFIIVLFALIKSNYSKYDIINFHIAYPNCTYIKLLRVILKKPLIISEHWSAYHFNFNIENKKKLNRITNIFKQSIPIFTVSQSLARDIENFAHCTQNSFIVPNVVDTSTFYFTKDYVKKQNKTFFMVSQWQWPKLPLEIVHSWKDVLNSYCNAKLIIGGYGPDWSLISKTVNNLNLSKSVQLVGNLNSKEIANYMNQCDGFIHNSIYETFSVVCAEAICCGLPVLSRKVGGITEFINDSNGKYIDSANLSRSIIEFIDVLDSFDRISISKAGKNLFSKESVGEKYYQSINEVLSCS